MSLFKGSGVALVTPFTKDNKINFSKFEELIEFHISQGTDALLPVGTTGESPALNDEEKIALYKFTVEKTKGRIPVIAGTGSNDTKHAVYLTQAAVSAGVDGVLAVTPYYNKGNESGLIHYYQSVADAAKGRSVMVYNVPGRTGVNLSLAVLKAIAKTPNINMLKEASGNISYVAECVREVPSLALYSGNDDMVVPLMSLGGLGVVSVSANIMPNITHKMAEAFLNGDLVTARNLQLTYNDLINALFIEVNPVPIKEAMNILGFDVGACRSPLGPMAQENKEKLSSLLKIHGIKK